MIPEKWGPVFGKDHALAKHDPEKAYLPDLIRIFFVMAGLVPAIHVFATRKAWMPATSAGMTMK